MNSNTQTVSPARSVPGLLRLMVLLGTPPVQMGLAWMVMAALFFWISGIGMGSKLVYRLAGRTSTGLVTEVQHTALTVKHAGPLLIFKYQFRTSDGRAYTGFSYHPGRRTCDVGNEVPVEYLSFYPHMNHMQGMSRSVFDSPEWLELICWLLPWIGVLLLVAGLRSATRVIRVLRRGPVDTNPDQPSAGTDLDALFPAVDLPSDTRNNDAVVAMAIFRVLLGAFSKKEAGPRLRDPANPGRPVYLGSLPGNPRIDGNGDLQLREDYVRTLALLIIAPVAFILVNCVGVYVSVIR